MVKKRIIFILAILLFFSCYIDQPHDSRYDTLNPFGKSSIYIEVYDKKGIPIESVSVTINDTLTFYTDKKGVFSLGTFIHGVISFDIEKEGYRILEKDTLLKSGIPLSLAIELNFIPVIESFRAYSSVKRIISFDDTIDYNTDYIAEITEKDEIEDIDSCVMRISTMRFPMDIYEKDGAIICSLKFEEENGFFNIYDMQGEDAFIEVYDKSKEMISSWNTNVVRFIERIPSIIFPENGGTLTLPDTLKWSPSDELFESYFRIEILNDSTTVFFKDSIKSTDSILYIDTLFRENSYKMVLKHIDMFGNYSENSVIFSVF